MQYIQYYSIYVLMIVITWIYDRNTGKLSNVLFKDQLYMCWLLMSISIFDYKIPYIQYLIRFFATGYTMLVSIKKISRYGFRTYWIAIPFSLFWLVAGISLFYTVDIIETAFKVFEILADFLLVAALFQKENQSKMIQDVIKITIGMYIFMLLSAVLGFVALHNVNIFARSNDGLLGTQLMGGIVGANSIGNMAVILWIWLINEPRFRNKMLLYGLSLFVILFAQSRTSLILMAFMLLFNVFGARHKTLYVSVILMLVLVLYNAQALVSEYFIRGAALSNITSMSGRTTMWAVARKYIAERPLLGYGYGVGGYIVSSQFENMSSLHNGVYETLMGIGFVGLIPQALIYIGTCLGIAKGILITGIKRYSFECMMIIYLTVRTYTSTGIGGWHSHEMMVWFFLAMMVASMRSHSTYREIEENSACVEVINEENA